MRKVRTKAQRRVVPRRPHLPGGPGRTEAHSELERTFPGSVCEGPSSKLKRNLLAHLFPNNPRLSLLVSHPPFPAEAWRPSNTLSLESKLHHSQRHPWPLTQLPPWILMPGCHGPWFQSSRVLSAVLRKWALCMGHLGLDSSPTTWSSDYTSIFPFFHLFIGSPGAHTVGLQRV